MNRYKSSTLGTNHGQWPRCQHYQSLVVIVLIVLCSGGRSSDCGGSHVMLCHGGFVAWWLWQHLHGLMVVVVAVVLQWQQRLCYVVVALWHSYYGGGHMA